MGLFSIFQKSSTLYFPDCLTYFKFPEYFELYKKIFSKLGIGFVVLNKQNCCGLRALEAGYEAEARKLARKNLDNFREKEIERIITNSPECYKMFLQNYPEILPDWDIKVDNIWKIILEKLENKPKLIKNKAMEIIGYQDSCYLGRYCKIFDEPRKILELIGYEIKEMPDSRENSICCGSCGGLSLANPELADKIAKQKILQAKRIKVNKLVVFSMENYELLKKNAKDIKILEFSEVLADALGIKKREEVYEKEEKIEGEEAILEEDNLKFKEELKEEDYYEKGEEYD